MPLLNVKTILIYVTIEEYYQRVITFNYYFKSTYKSRMFYSFLTSITFWKMINKQNNTTSVTFDKTVFGEQTTNMFVRCTPIHHIVVKYKKFKLKKTFIT